MIIEEIMHKDVVTLHEHATIADAIQTLNQHRIRHLPIINNEDKIIGIVTDHDIRDVRPSILHPDEHKEDLLKPIATIMNRAVITAHPLDFVEEVSYVFYEQHIGCLPIVEEEKVVGIITETDILHTLVELMGAHQPSSQIEVKVENVTGKLAEIADIFRNRRINITSVLVYPCKDANYKILVFRVHTMDPRGVIADIEKEGYKVLWPNMPGINL